MQETLEGVAKPPLAGKRKCRERERSSEDVEQGVAHVLGPLSRVRGEKKVAVFREKQPIQKREG